MAVSLLKGDITRLTVVRPVLLLSLAALLGSLVGCRPRRTPRPVDDVHLGRLAQARSSPRHLASLSPAASRIPTPFDGPISRALTETTRTTLLDLTGRDRQRCKQELACVSPLRRRADRLRRPASGELQADLEVISFDSGRRRCRRRDPFRGRTQPSQGVPDARRLRDGQLQADRRVQGAPSSSRWCQTPTADILPFLALVCSSRLVASHTPPGRSTRAVTVPRVSVSSAAATCAALKRRRRRAGRASYVLPLPGPSSSTDESG